MFEQIRPGMIGETEVLVTPETTARYLGSGEVSVFATPEMVRLMERAAVAAVDHTLPEGCRTVGVHLDVQHQAATPQGMIVRARATLERVEGRKLTFRVEAWDKAEIVGSGTHDRVIIDTDRFRERANKKLDSLQRPQLA